jgi:hypothetical protein
MNFDELLAVKIEVDTRPPQGAGLETTLVRRHVLLNLQHHDQAQPCPGADRLGRGVQPSLLDASQSQGHPFVYFLHSPGPAGTILNIKLFIGDSLQAASTPAPQHVPFVVKFANII